MAKQSIIAYKGFNTDLTCRDFQFQIGETYTHEGKVKACASGFHACENPLDVFNYYNPASRFAIVECSGKISKESDGASKIACGSIHIKAEIGLPTLISKAVDLILSKIEWDTAKESNTDNRSTATNTGSRSAATNTGSRSAAANTGNRSAATNTGYQSAATNTGLCSAAANTGLCSTATNTGDRSTATNTGYQSAATNTGYRSAAANTGLCSTATNTGDRSAATNTGDRSTATNTGDQSAAINTGNRSAATNTGNRSAAEVTGSHSVAAAFGYESKAKAGEGGAIVCVYRDDDNELVHIRASKVGDNGIEAGKWYTLNESGEFIEAK